MTAAFVDALKAEIGQLDRALRGDIRYARLLEAQRLLALYEGSSENQPLHHFIPPSLSFAVPRGMDGFRHEAASRRTSPERARALETAQMYVRNRRGPVPTADIFSHLQSLGIPIGGKEPVNNLSAMLSNSNQFQSNGRAGWTLRKPSALGGDSDDTYDYDGPWDDNDATNSDPGEPSTNESRDADA